MDNRSYYRDETCECCGAWFRFDDLDAPVDQRFCPDCADNKVYGVICDH